MDDNSYKEALEDSAETQRHRISPYPEYSEFILSNINGSCLEIGCGDGIGTRIFRPKCRDMVSIDLSPGRIKRAKENTKGLDVDFILADARQLPFADGSFDTVLAFEVYEHFPEYSDQERFLKEVKRVLKKDGLFLISTPNKPFFRLYCFLIGEKHPTHFSEVGYSRFKKSLKRFFSEVEIHGKFGWLSPLYKFGAARNIHDFLSRFPLICKGLLAVCRG